MDFNPFDLAQLFHWSAVWTSVPGICQIPIFLKIYIPASGYAELLVWIDETSKFCIGTIFVDGGLLPGFIAPRNSPFGEVIPAGFSACVPVDQDMVPWHSIFVVSGKIERKQCGSSKLLFWKMIKIGLVTDRT